MSDCARDRLGRIGNNYGILFWKYFSVFLTFLFFPSILMGSHYEPTKTNYSISENEILDF